ncbi:MAG: YqaE/Pmp3 family membrane protein [Pseudomonadota bacterium]
MDLLKIVLAIFLPPLAVFLQAGIGMHLLINIILTICFFLPGSIHALWVIVKKK